MNSRILDLLVAFFFVLFAYSMQVYGYEYGYVMGGMIVNQI